MEEWKEVLILHSAPHIIEARITNIKSAKVDKKHLSAGETRLKF